MANDDVELFHFWRRYKWAVSDFEAFQSAMVDTSRGPIEGLFSGGIMSGFDVSFTGALTVQLSAGIASSPSGQMLVQNVTNSFAVTAPGSNTRRDLIVLRPTLTDNTPIAKPTDLMTTVFLKQKQGVTVVYLSGTASTTPTYPATVSGDVVVCGVRITAGQATLTTDDLDFEVRDILGKNSNFQKFSSKYDDRLRSYRSDNHTIGVKPSQLVSISGPRLFTYVNAGAPSKFPRDGSGNFASGDTFINFTTGAVTGSDLQTPDFVPTIPTSGNCIVATVSLQTNDQLKVDYGIQGTRTQCFSAIRNQTTVGAGSIVNRTDSFNIAYVVLQSSDGTSITELDLFDKRSHFNFGQQNNASLVPAAVIMPYAGASAPSGWLLCDGSAVSRVTYATLFAAISTTYGVGDGSTTFNVPDLRGRAVIGLDNMGVGSANRVVNAQADILGGSMGEENHTISAGELPSHTHSISASGSGTTSSTGLNHNHIQQVTNGSVAKRSHINDIGADGNYLGIGANFDSAAGATPLTTENTDLTHSHPFSVTVSGTSGSVGSGTAANNMQPTIALNYIIKTF